MSIVCVCVTVKMQFDNTRTCKYSIILALCSVAMLLRAFGPPYSKILDPSLIPVVKVIFKEFWIIGITILNKSF